MTPIALDAHAWGGWGLTGALALLWVLGGIAASLPWLAAHLEFWGRRKGRVWDCEAGERLVEVALFNLGPLFLASVMVVLFVSTENAAEFFPAAVFSAKWLFALAPLSAVYGALLWGYRGGGAMTPQSGLRVGLAVLAGAVALVFSGILWVVSLAVAEPELLPVLRKEFVSIVYEGRFRWGMLHFYLTAFAAGGVMLMWVGRRSFVWQSRIPVSDGARLIWTGAWFSLVCVVVQVGLGGGWMFFQGPETLRRLLFSGGPQFVMTLALACLGVVMLLEALVTAIRWRGSAPRASLAAAALLVFVVFSAASSRYLIQKTEFWGGRKFSSSGMLRDGRR